MNRDPDKLLAAAESWTGTPFCEQSAAKGAGVCCHAAVLEVYFEAGWLPRFLYPVAPLRSGVRTADKFFAEDKHFERLESNASQVGDTLFFRTSHIAHFALCLSGAKYFHAQHGSKAGIAPNIQPAWMKRLVCIYRPL